MKIAVISDIHGNIDALVTVLEKAKNENVAHLLILGDLVGYYYHPDKIMDLLSHWSFDIIKGNHEKILENLIVDSSLAETIRLKYGSGHQEAINKLTKEQLYFLTHLPETKKVEFDQISLLMCHGSPWSNDFYIYPDCKKEIINKCDVIDFDFVLVGHSHYPFAIRNKNSVLINPGSVGQSRQTGGKASWCVINTDNSCFQFFSTDYNTKDLVKEVSEKDPEIEYLTKVLMRK
mgnify:CR=1 FL=1